MKQIFLLLTLLLSSLLTLSAQTYIYSGDKRYDYDSRVLSTWDGTRLYSGDKRYDYDSRVRYTIDGPLPVAVAICLIL